MSLLRQGRAVVSALHRLAIADQRASLTAITQHLNNVCLQHSGCSCNTCRWQQRTLSTHRSFSAARGFGASSATSKGGKEAKPKDAADAPEAATAEKSETQGKPTGGAQSEETVEEESAAEAEGGEELRAQLDAAKASEVKLTEQASRHAGMPVCKSTTTMQACTDVAIITHTRTLIPLIHITYAHPCYRDDRYWACAVALPYPHMPHAWSLVFLGSQAAPALP